MKRIDNPQEPAAYVEEVHKRLTALINAAANCYVVLTTIDNPAKYVPEKLIESYNAVRERAAELVAIVGKRLDKLAGEYLTTEPGEWLHELQEDIGHNFIVDAKQCRAYVAKLTHRQAKLRSMLTALKADGPHVREPKKQRRRGADRKPAQLTKDQIEAVQLVAEHKGNVTAAAKAAGKSRQAMQKLYDKANSKLGKHSMDIMKTQAIPPDARGQRDPVDPKTQKPKNDG